MLVPRLPVHHWRASVEQATSPHGSGFRRRRVCMCLVNRMRCLTCCCIAVLREPLFCFSPLTPSVVGIGTGKSFLLTTVYLWCLLNSKKVSPWIVYGVAVCLNVCVALYLLWPRSKLPLRQGHVMELKLHVEAFQRLIRCPMSYIIPCTG